MPSHRVTLLPGLASLLWVIGCGGPGANSFRLNPEVRRPARSVVLFFVDGMNRRRFEQLLARGDLPNIDRCFVRGGVGVTHAIVSMPALTYSNAVSLLTGRFPGHHGILGNRWFDRSTLAYQDYILAATYRDVNHEFTAPTIYEILHDRFTVNVQGHTRRGVTTTFDHWAMSGINCFFGNYPGIDTRAGGTIQWVFGLANHVRRWPTILTFYFPGSDMVGHHRGSNTPEYAGALRNIDAQVGRVIDAVEAAGLSGSTWFVLMTDHGHVQRGKGRSFDLSGWLRDRAGLRIYQDHLALEAYVDRHDVLKRYDAVLVSEADRKAAIHLRGPEGWSSPATQACVRRVLNGHTPSGERPPSQATGPRLYERPAVAAACIRDGADRVLVMTRQGCFAVERHRAQGRRVYRLLPARAEAAGCDPASNPLGYRASPELAAFVDAGWHGSRAWLAATAATRFPDFVPQVVEMFDSPRAGDIVLFADEDWVFDSNEPSGHGSCLAEDMRVPLFFAGPNLPRGGRIDHARLVDIMPTVLDLLGESGRLEAIGPIDGTSIAAELKAADASKESDTNAARNQTAAQLINPCCSGGAPARP